MNYDYMNEQYYQLWAERFRQMRQFGMTNEQKARAMELYATQDAEDATRHLFIAARRRRDAQIQHANIPVVEEDAPVPAVPAQAAPAPEPVIPAAQRRDPEGWAEFQANREQGRIPHHATYGGIHRRRCGHAGCDRVGGVMGVRFVTRRYRCEVHEA
jgi:hypothetical protein